MVMYSTYLWQNIYLWERFIEYDNGDGGDSYKMSI